MKVYIECDVKAKPDTAFNCKKVLAFHVASKGFPQREYEKKHDKHGNEYWEETELSRAAGGYDRLLVKEEI